MILLMGLAYAQVPQVAPWTFEPAVGIQTLVFVRDGCDACTRLAAALDRLDVVYVGHESTLPYEPYHQDALGLMAKTFRVVSYPTAVVLQGRQEVLRQEGFVDVAVVEASVNALATGAMVPPWQVGLDIGERVEGGYENFTGLVVYWDTGCEACVRERPQLAQIAAETRTEVRVIGAVEQLPDGVSASDSSVTASSWGLPGAPMHIYLRDGVPLWIDAGFRGDLVAVLMLVLELADSG